ncbi:MAG: dTMP kinase [Planctomycetes bacterium]|nr:dTMP kinase [Planctomycetota bacterium]
MRTRLLSPLIHRQSIALRVQEILVEPGDEVEKDQPLVTFAEETGNFTLVSPRAGRIEFLSVEKNELVRPCGTVGELVSDGPSFIVLEGIDGSGKSTQVDLLAKYLAGAGKDALKVRDPGTTRLGESIRDILLGAGVSGGPGAEITKIGNTAQILLFMAARAQMIDESVRPALEEGRIVISDRFIMSTYVYQQQDVTNLLSVQELGTFACREIVPDVTLFLDVSPKTAFERSFDKPGDKIFRGSLTQLESLHRAYASLYGDLEAMEESVAKVSGEGAPDEVSKRVISMLEELKLV